MSVLKMLFQCAYMLNRFHDPDLIFDEFLCVHAIDGRLNHFEGKRFKRELQHNKKRREISLWEKNNWYIVFETSNYANNCQI
jgi:hypothetical protein